MTTGVNSDKIHLVQVQLVKGGLESSEAFQRNAVYPKSYTFTIGHRLFYIATENLIAVYLDVTLTGFKETGKEGVSADISANYIYHFYFKVDNITEFEDNGKIDSSIMVTLLSISYSTLRGIILERTRGALSSDGVILPVINPMKLLEEHALLPDIGPPISANEEK